MLNCTQHHYTKSDEQMVNSPQWLGVLSISRLALGFVSSGAAREGAVRGVVAGDVSGAVAAGRGTLELLRMRLELRAVGARTTGQAAHKQTAYNGVPVQRTVACSGSQSGIHWILVGRHNSEAI